MFSHAYEIAFQYTLPVIVSSRTLGNTVQCGGGAFVVINREGWILTVAHIFETATKFRQDQPGPGRLLRKYPEDPE